MSRAPKNPKIERQKFAASRALVTIGAELWDAAREWHAAGAAERGIPVALEGSIVRLMPPASATDDEILDVMEWVKQKAVAVKLVAREQADSAVPSGAVAEQAAAPARTHRQVVMDLAAESTTVAGLSDFCSDVMDREAL